MEDKKNYQEKMEAQIDEWKKDLEALKARANAAKTDLKLKYEEQIKELEPKIAEGKAKLKELADATDDAWEEVKDGAESIWEQMKITFKNVKDKFDKDEEKV